MQDQGHRERDHREVHGPDPAVEGEVGEEGGEQGGAQDGARERERRAPRVDPDHAVRVAADAEERRLAEGEDAGDAPDQVEAQREQAEGHEHRELDDLERRQQEREPAEGDGAGRPGCRLGPHTPRRQKPEIPCGRRRRRTIANASIATCP